MIYQRDYGSEGDPLLIDMVPIPAPAPPPPSRKTAKLKRPLSEILAESARNHRAARRGAVR